MPIVTDLANTIWRFNNTVSITETVSYDISISWTYTSFNGMYFEANENSRQVSWSRGTFMIAHASGTDTQIPVESYVAAHPEFIITGGSDTHNDALIAWLEANATYMGALNSKPYYQIRSFPATNVMLSSSGLSGYFNFISNSRRFSTLSVTGTSIEYGGTKVYSASSGWVDPLYRNICVLSPIISDDNFSTYLNIVAPSRSINNTSSFQVTDITRATAQTSSIKLALDDTNYTINSLSSDVPSRPMTGPSSFNTIFLGKASSSTNPQFVFESTNTTTSGSFSQFIVKNNSSFAGVVIDINSGQNQGTVNIDNNLAKNVPISTNT